VVSQSIEVLIQEMLNVHSLRVSQKVCVQIATREMHQNVAAEIGENEAGVEDSLSERDKVIGQNPKIRRQRAGHVVDDLLQRREQFVDR